MALQLRVRNHQRQPHGGFFDRKVGGLGGRWRKQSWIRTVSAGTTHDRRGRLPHPSNRGEGSIEVV
jgi:hypothetical protein